MPQYLPWVVVTSVVLTYDLVAALVYIVDVKTPKVRNEIFTNYDSNPDFKNLNPANLTSTVKSGFYVFLGKRQVQSKIET